MKSNFETQKKKKKRKKERMQIQNLSGSNKDVAYLGAG